MSNHSNSSSSGNHSRTQSGLSATCPPPSADVAVPPASLGGQGISPSFTSPPPQQHHQQQHQAIDAQLAPSLPTILNHAETACVGKEKVDMLSASLPSLFQPNASAAPTPQREECTTIASPPGSLDRCFPTGAVDPAPVHHGCPDGVTRHAYVHPHLEEEEDEVSDHLAHGTHDHSDDHTKDVGVMSSPNTNPRSPSQPHKDMHAEKPPRINLLHLFNARNIGVTIVPVIGGLISGYTIALVPVYSQLYVSGTNCALYTAQRGCEAVPFADCVWHTTTVTQGDGTVRSLGYCGWPSITCRATYPNDGWMGGGGDTALAEASCLRDGRCTWSYSAGECQNPSGYSTKELGLFAGAMIAGSMFGAILGGPLVTSMGTRLTFLVSGFYSVIACIMGHADSYVNDFWVLASSRFILGFFMGLITVACPLYVHENADPKYKAKTGTMFQVFGTTGSFITAIICIGVGETIHYDANADQHISARMQAVTAGQTLLSILLFLLGIFSAETKVKFKKGEKGALDQDEYSYRKMWPRLLMVIALSATFRFTGFNALANFGPALMASYNLAPFTGVFIIMTVNFAGGLLSMPVSLAVSPRWGFLFGSCFISCMCLFLCGIPVYPGVAAQAITNTCAVVGICLYIFFYEMFVGPSFYVLCQEIFPPSFRPRGNSIAQLSQFVFNLIINICYSIGVVGLSGGPSGNQHKGQSIIFIFFGGLGILLFVYELLCLDLWDETAEAERKAKAALGEPTEGERSAAERLAPSALPVLRDDPAARMPTDYCVESESEGLYLEHDADRQEMDLRV